MVAKSERGGLKNNKSPFLVVHIRISELSKEKRNIILQEYIVNKIHYCIDSCELQNSSS